MSTPRGRRRACRRRRPRRRRSRARRHRRRPRRGPRATRRRPRSRCAGAGRAAARAGPDLPGDRSSRTRIASASSSVAARFEPAQQAVALRARRLQAVLRGHVLARDVAALLALADHGRQAGEVAQRRPSRSAGMRSGAGRRPRPRPSRSTRTDEAAVAVVTAATSSATRGSRPAGTPSSSEKERSILRLRWPGTKPSRRDSLGDARRGRRGGLVRRARVAPAPSSGATAPPPPPESRDRAGVAVVATALEARAAARRRSAPRSAPAARASRDRQHVRRRPLASGPRGARASAARHPRPRCARRPSAGRLGRRLRRRGAQLQRELLQLARDRVVVVGGSGAQGASTAASSRSIVAVSSGGVIAGLSQLRHGSVQRVPALVSRRPSTRGDLGVREPAGELQGDQVALVAVEGGERGAHRLAAERQLGVVLGRGRPRPPGRPRGVARRLRPRSSSSAALRAIPNSHASRLPRPGR